MATRFELQLTGMGWADLVFAEGKKERRVKVSWVHDTVGDIVRAMAEACERVGKHEIPATDEMDDVLITIRRLETEIEIIVKRRLERGGPGSYGEWKKLIRLGADTSTIAAAFCTGWGRTLGALGTDGYRAGWGHAFPVAAWESVNRYAGSPNSVIK